MKKRRNEERRKQRAPQPDFQVHLTLPVVALTSLAWQSTEPVRIRPSWLVATQVRGPW